MLCFSIVSWLRGFAKAGPKSGSCEGSTAQDVNKICTTPARESNFCEKKAPRCMFGALLEVFSKLAPRLRARALLEVELRKICTTPRESDFEVKIVKAPGARDVFGGSKCFSRGRRRDLGTLQNTWQAQEFVRVAKTGVVDLKRLRNDVFRVAGAGSCAL